MESIAQTTSGLQSTDLDIISTLFVNQRWYLIYI